MATMPELIEVLEEYRVDTGATLELFGRRLREANRITKGKRGRGAAHMTYLDAARVLIACAATDHPERAADSEYEFSNTILSDSDGPELTLDSALAELLEKIASGELMKDAGPATLAHARDPKKQHVPIPPIVSLIVWRAGVQARLQVQDCIRVFRHRSLIAVTKALADGGMMERAKDYEHATARFRSGKNPTAELGFGLFQAVAKLIAGKGDE